jgi:hypothetical protein
MCGVAVVAGYVRCPKCHAGLPMGRTKRTTVEPGGTAVEPRRFPVVPVAIGGAVVLVGLVVGLSLRGDGTRSLASAAAPALPGPIAAIAVPPRTRSPGALLAQPSSAGDPAQAAVQDARAATAALESALRVQRLWGRATTTFPRVELRSGSCSDPAMRPLIESQRSVLRSAGLTRLRCVEQSGAVVFELDL